MKVFKGLAASRGIAIGSVKTVHTEAIEVPEFEVKDPVTELARYEKCRSGVDASLEALVADISEKAGAEHGEIFEIQREFLTDPGFGDAVADCIAAEKINAEAAVIRISDALVQEFKEIGDDYFSQRAVDIRDLADRLVRFLQGKEAPVADLSDGVRIMFAHDFSPSDTASMDLTCTLALCTEVGGKTSHTAILSRSLGIPSIVGLGNINLEDGAKVIVDAIRGELIVEPDSSTVREYEERRDAFLLRRARLMEGAHEKARTADGEETTVAANVASAPDAYMSKEYGAEGIGLLRTEFLFLQRSDLPDEEEQYKTYRKIIDFFPDQAVIVRSLDVGGDKDLPAIPMELEQNPFLGRRALRLAFSDPDRLLIPQIKAVLRAGIDRNVKLMFPMVGSVAEVVRVKAFVERAKTELLAGGIPFSDTVELGIMIEIPSAAIIAERLARHVDFFSVGTNDLTQYTLAVDRTNELVADLADHFHPAVISLIASVIEGAHAHNRWVGMCGEMAGDTLAVPLLVGLGLDEFSMAGAVVPDVKALVRQLRRSQCQELARAALEVSTAGEVRNLCEEFAASLS